MLLLLPLLLVFLSASQTVEILDNEGQEVNPATVHHHEEYYPAPPYNLSVQMRGVLDGYARLLEATVHWDAAPDAERTGFYLKIRAADSDSPEPKCARDFGGYLSASIPATARRHAIPAESPDFGEPLVLEHGCEYQVELSSLPRPHQDPLYVFSTTYTVPECVDGLCACKEPLPAPTDLKAEVSPETMRVRVEWRAKYEAPQFTTSDDGSPSSSLAPLTFFVSLWERPMQKSASENDLQVSLQNALFRRWRLVEEATEHAVVADTKSEWHETTIPVRLHADDTDYRVSVFALDNRLCHSPDADVEVEMRNRDDDDDDIVATTKKTELVKPIESGAKTTTAVPKSIEKEGASTSANIGLAVIGALILLALFVGAILAGAFRCLARRFGRLSSSSGKCRQDSTSSATGALDWPASASVLNLRTSVLQRNVLYANEDAATSRMENGQDDDDDSSWFLPACAIQSGAVIGEGAFGLVVRGRLIDPPARCFSSFHPSSTSVHPKISEGGRQSISVAIKQLKPDAAVAQCREFQQEIRMMRRIGRHPNLVQLYGYCTEPGRQCVVMEFVPHGDLRRYLQDLRKKSESAITAQLESSAQQDELHYRLDPRELLDFAAQIANGMAHLESLGVTHRDLAARNILVGDAKLLKISDFGLSRYGIYVKQSRGVIPLRWLSVEAIREHVYSTKSDVWSYGVVLWELCTLGGFPYATVADHELARHLADGNRLERPLACSDKIYDLQSCCWAERPTDRPSFAFIVEHLAELRRLDAADK